MYCFTPLLTSDMDIENLRIALFNYICAAQEKVGLGIRINDTNKQENIEEIQMLEQFKIKHQYPTYQSNSLKFHRQFAMKLLSEKKAYSCFCTKEELKNKQEVAQKEGRAYRYDGTCRLLKDIEVLDNENPFVIRIQKPALSVSFTDTLKGRLCFEPNEIDDFVIMQQDKYPTRNFACAIDDMIGNTTHIISKEEYVLDTAKQIFIQKYLGYNGKIKYTHLPCILNEQSKNISKNDDMASIKWLLDEGFLPEAISNYLILLGSQAPKDIFTVQEAIKWFDIEKFSKSPVKFDIKHLQYINKEHMKLLDDVKLASLIGYSSKDIGVLAKLYTEEASTLKKLKQKIDTIFTPREFPKEIENECTLLAKFLKEAPVLDDFDEFKQYLIKKTKLQEKNLLKPLQFILTGSFDGLELKDIYPTLKKLFKEIHI